MKNLELAKKVYECNSYWQKWELMKIKFEESPEAYQEVLRELKKLEQSSKQKG